MKIGIIGTGGVGGYFGGRLAQAGFDITFLARGKHKEAMDAHGLMIKSIKGDFHLPEVKVTDNILNMAHVDLIVLGLKAWQVKEVVSDLLTIVNEDTVILPLQNGVTAVEDLRAQIPVNNILGGLCRIVSKIDSPGVINHFAAEPTIILGELDNSNSPRLLKIKATFDEAGIDAKIADNIESELWKKFIAICSGGVLAITRSSFGEVRELPETRKLLKEMFAEIIQLANKMKVQLPENFLDKAMGFVDTFPYEVASSLARDIWDGRPSEIENLNGTVVKMAESVNLEVPVNRFIYHSLMPMELRARKVKHANA